MNIKTALIILLHLPVFGAFTQIKPPKSNPMPVYMHYMPWFDTPETSGNQRWGWHWTMNNKDPQIIIDPATGKREIASHFYPLTGPYASNDRDILEYHFLLMKYSGIDGVLIDWYGTTGSNTDIQNLLRNSNAIAEYSEKAGLKFGVVLEDRFATSVDDVKQNVGYLKEHYFNRTTYIRMEGSGDPLLAVFGPITYQQPDQWTAILKAAGEDVEFVTLWNESTDAGASADGEYMWIWENESSDNYFSHLESYYKNTAPSLKTVMGVAYPGFSDFYKEGNAGDGYFDIPHENGTTLNKTLALADRYKDHINMIQLATWNDYGEGTMIEPTFETGFEYLRQIQSYTGVPYDLSELLLIFKLYELRKIYKTSPVQTSLLDQAGDHLNNLHVDEARTILESVERTTGPAENSAAVRLQVYPNPSLEKELKVKITGDLPLTKMSLLITDLGGRTVYHQQVIGGEAEYTVVTEKPEKGMYMIHLHVTDGVIASRILVID